MRLLALAALTLGLLLCAGAAGAQAPSGGQSSGTYYAEDFGMKCDATLGVPGSGHDDSAALQSAIDRIEAAGGGRLLFPNRTCTVDTVDPTARAGYDYYVNIHFLGAHRFGTGTSGTAFQPRSRSDDIIVFGRGARDYTFENIDFSDCRRAFWFKYNPADVGNYHVNGVFENGSSGCDDTFYTDTIWGFGMRVEHWHFADAHYAFRITGANPKGSQFDGVYVADTYGGGRLGYLRMDAGPTVAAQFHNVMIGVVENDGFLWGPTVAMGLPWLMDSVGAELVGSSLPALVTTTGACAAGSDVVTVASTKGFAAGNPVNIAYAGAGRRDHLSAIVSVDGPAALHIRDKCVHSVGLAYGGTDVEVAQAQYMMFHASNTSLSLTCINSNGSSYASAELYFSNVGGSYDNCSDSRPIASEAASIIRASAPRRRPADYGNHPDDDESHIERFAFDFGQNPVRNYFPLGPGRDFDFNCVDSALNASGAWGELAVRRTDQAGTAVLSADCESGETEARSFNPRPGAGGGLPTNLVPYSNDFASRDSRFTRLGRASLVAKAAAAPEIFAVAAGEPSAARLRAEAGTGEHGWQIPAFKVWTAGRYTASVYLKAGTARYAYEMLSGAALAYAVIDLETCAVTASGGAHASASPVKEGYCRLAAEADLAAGTWQFAVGLSDGPGFARSWAAAGTETIDLYGAQINRGALAAYEPTRDLTGLYLGAAGEPCLVAQGWARVCVDAAGNVRFLGVPTADPHVAGAVWSNRGVLTLSGQ